MSESVSRANKLEKPKQGQNIVVLVEPEIPSNTGNIARTCVLTGTALHLVEPLGFSLEDRYLKRAGLDYWPDLDVKIWPDLQSFEAWLDESCPSEVTSTEGPAPLLAFYATTHAEKTLSSLDLKPEDRAILIFGKETAGLPKDFLARHSERCMRIPMLHHHSRSLNLSNSVAIFLYEVLRQEGYPELS